jgi:hypothetical protein
VLGIMAATGETPRMLSQIASFSGSFAADGKSVFYPVLQRGGMRIERYDLASGTVTPVGALPGVLFKGAVSRDGKQVALSRGDILSDVLLLTLKPRSE